MVNLDLKNNPVGVDDFKQNAENLRKDRWLKEFPRGAKLLTYLFQILISCEADQQLEPLLRLLFVKSSQPILSMVSDFINQGDFEDPCSEFWIEKTPLRMTKDLTKIPGFLEHCARQIFQTGYALNLLRS